MTLHGSDSNMIKPDEIDSGFPARLAIGCGDSIF